MTDQQRKRILFTIGLIMFLAGFCTLGFFGVRKLHRMHTKQELLKTHIALEIPDLNITAPVLEGTDNDTLAKGVGHFPASGTLAGGNYCIAGHSSPIYIEYFNNLKNAEKGMTVSLKDPAGPIYSYMITEMFIVEKTETWILDDFNDDRVTLVTCTDDGLQRRVIIAKKHLTE